MPSNGTIETQMTQTSKATANLGGEVVTTAGKTMIPPAKGYIAGFKIDKE